MGEVLLPPRRKAELLGPRQAGIDSQMRVVVYLRVVVNHGTAVDDDSTTQSSLRAHNGKLTWTGVLPAVIASEAWRSMSSWYAGMDCHVAALLAVTG